MKHATAKTATIRLRQGPDALIRQGHPWIFKGAISQADGASSGVYVVDVLASTGEWIARGLMNPQSELSVRVFTRNPDEKIDAALIARRLDEAICMRERLLVTDGENTNSCRLVFSESDLLSGLIVDRYADVLSVQVRAGIWQPYLEGVVAHLKKRTGLTRVRLAANPDHAQREGIDQDLLTRLSDTITGVVRVREHGFSYDVDVGEGHKTGFYLDQRENRRRVAAYAGGRSVLSAYCYTGAFELHAARAGAKEILGLDCSEPALAQATSHHALNGSTVPARYERADVPQMLRKFRDAARTFEMIILDPPRFVVSRAQKEKGLRAYKDINLMAMKLLAPGGVLATFSCSGLVSGSDFRTAIEWAARDANRTVTIIESLGQPPDHPILTAFPESEYLKGLVCWVR
ncbi:MAG: class I SAM-dependent rRNA methyltransferase [Verrucomicrobia bacterium]|nr:class I SAM-dependent rRNA methyltransferase [Verrucomicrobiota bacterium]